jgi:hypothetical protein
MMVDTAFFNKNRAHGVMSLDYNPDQPTCSAVRKADDGELEIWIFLCLGLLQFNPSYLCSPVTERLLSVRALWRAPPIGITTVYELLHRNGSQYPWQQQAAYASNRGIHQSAGPLR